VKDLKEIPLKIFVESLFCSLTKIKIKITEIKEGIDAKRKSF